MIVLFKLKDFLKEKILFKNTNIKEFIVIDTIDDLKSIDCNEITIIYEYSDEIFKDLIFIKKTFFKVYFFLFIKKEDCKNIQNIINNGLVDYIQYIPFDSLDVLNKHINNNIKDVKSIKNRFKSESFRKKLSKNEFLNYKSMIKSFYIYDLIYGDIEKVNLMRDFIGELKIDIKPNYVITIMLDDFWEICKELDNKFRYHIKKDCLNLTEKAIELYNIDAISCSLIGTDKIIIMARVDEFSQNIINTSIINIANSIQNYINENADYSVTLGIGDKCSNFKEIYKSYEQSFQALKLSFFLGKNQVIIYDDKMVNFCKKSQIQDFDAFKFMFFKNFSKLNYDDSIGAYNTIFDNFTLNQINKEIIKALISNFIFEIFYYAIDLGLNKNIIHTKALESSSKILDSNSIVAIKETGDEFIKYILLELKKSKKTCDISLESAKAFIDKYYYTDISLKDLSYISNMSESYFSRKFKEKYKINFINYLIDVRLGKSLELLKDDSLSIENISELVGFKEYSYFSKSFKTKYKIAPYHFRERLKNKDF